MQILGLVGMYFDAGMVEVKTFFIFIQIGSGLTVARKHAGSFETRTHALEWGLENKID